MPPRSVPPVGKKFGRLTVVGFDHIDDRLRSQWKVRCDCGNEIVRDAYNLKDGTTRSCGCLNSEITSKRMRTHGLKGTPEHRTWDSMKTRCLNPNAANYADYGGRGITICAKWVNSFEAFLADMGMRPTPAHTLDRIDVAGNYEPSNCRWASPQEQGDNKRNTKRLTVGGETLSMSQWVARTGLRRDTISARLKHGWTPERAVNTPVPPRKAG